MNVQVPGRRYLASESNQHPSSGAGGAGAHLNEAEVESILLSKADAMWERLTAKLDAASPSRHNSSSYHSIQSMSDHSAAVPSAVAASSSPPVSPFSSGGKQHHRLPSVNVMVEGRKPNVAGKSPSSTEKHQRQQHGSPPSGNSKEKDKELKQNRNYSPMTDLLADAVAGEEESPLPTLRKSHSYTMDGKLKFIRGF